MNSIIQINETDKIVDIKDNLGTLHYKVILNTTTDTSASDTSTSKIVFVIKVINIVSLDNTIELYRETTEDKCIAKHLFDDKVKEYSLFVQAQYKDLSDINLYKEKIDYRKIDPDCCLNCAFCRNDVTKKYLECYNEKNYIFKDKYTDRNITFLQLHPRVDNIGYCKNYKRRDSNQDKLIPTISEKIHDIVESIVQSSVESSVAMVLERALIGIDGGKANED